MGREGRVDGRVLQLPGGGDKGQLGPDPILGLKASENLSKPLKTFRAVTPLSLTPQPFYDFCKK